MACSCTKRKVAQQAIKKSPQRPATPTKTIAGRRVIHRVIR